MYASVHTDRSSRVLVSADHGAAGMAGPSPIAMADAIPLPDGARLVTLPRDALAFGRDGRIRAIGRDRLALGAILPPGYVRSLFPAYAEDPSAPPLASLSYAAVAAGPGGEPLVAAVATGGSRARSGPAGGTHAVRLHASNALARQLARCAKENACVGAAAGVGVGELPVPLGAPSAERPVLPLTLHGGYAGEPSEAPTFRPSAREIADLAVDHASRGGSGVSFGRACDGEPLARIRVLADAARLLRERAPGAAIHLETSGSDPAALRRAIDAGVSRVTIRVGSALAETYARLHGPVAHRWADVRASLRVAAESDALLVIALLVLPGLTDRAPEIDALASLLDELGGGEIELRDLGCDPLRTLAALPAGAGIGVRALVGRLSEADHFHVGAAEDAAAATSR